MLLAVVPYSWNVGAPWGFGFEHHFRFIVRECGGRDQICCEDAPQCSQWNVCSTGHDDDPDHGTCRECGWVGDPCCTGAAQECAGVGIDREQHCTNSSPGSTPTCELCGGLGEECCSEVSKQIIVNDRFEQVTYLDWCGPGDLACNDGICDECGNRGDSCCPSGRCTSDDDVCDGGTCKPRHRPCGRPVRAGGGAEGGRFTIDLGTSSGVFDFEFNTFLYPDDIHLWIGDELLATTGCYGTAEIVPANHPDPFICTTDANARWCCDKNGDCVGTLKYESSSQLTVEVNANCSGLTPDTEWEFTANCPR